MRLIGRRTSLCFSSLKEKQHDQLLALLNRVHYFNSSTPSHYNIQMLKMFFAPFKKNLQHVRVSSRPDHYYVPISPISAAVFLPASLHILTFKDADGKKTGHDLCQNCRVLVGDNFEAFQKEVRHNPCL